MPTPPSSNGSPEAAPARSGSSGRGSPAGRILSLVLIVAGVALAAILLSLLSRAITAPVWRIVIALMLAFVIGRFSWGFFKQATNPPPPEPPAEAVPSEMALSYVCGVCGTELSVVRMAKEKPPKHCGEEMTLYVG